MTEAKHEPFRLYLFRSTSPQQIEREKIWKKKQRSLLVPPVHNHSFFMVTKECILWSMVCIVHTKQYLDRRFIIPFCFKQDYSRQRPAIVVVASLEALPRGPGFDPPWGRISALELKTLPRLSHVQSTVEPGLTHKATGPRVRMGQGFGGFLGIL